MQLSTCKGRLCLSSVSNVHWTFQRAFCAASVAAFSKTRQKHSLACSHCWRNSWGSFQTSDRKSVMRQTVATQPQIRFQAAMAQSVWLWMRSSLLLPFPLTAAHSLRDRRRFSWASLLWVCKYTDHLVRIQPLVNVLNTSSSSFMLLAGTSSCDVQPAKRRLPQPASHVVGRHSSIWRCFTFVCQAAAKRVANPQRHLGLLQSGHVPELAGVRPSFQHICRLFCHAPSSKTSPEIQVRCLLVSQSSAA